jgi:tetratricopeptide (TPR) repeat protein
VGKTLSSAAALISVIVGINASSVTALSRPVSGWTGRATPHFVIYTPNAQDGGTEILGRLESARLFFKQTAWVGKEADSQLKVVAFNSSKEYEAYRLNPGAYAFYQRTRQGDYVVMRDLDPQHFSVAVHEYTHFVVEHSGLKLPLWLNEGVADLYSTLEGHKSQVLVGAAPSGRESILNSQRWLDWQALVSVDQGSVYYRQPDKMLLFYSQSWALAHMLAMDAGYANKFPQFLSAVSNGATTDAALLAVYHKNLEQVGQEVEQYFGSKRMSAHLVNTDVRLASLETSDVVDAAKLVEFALAEVLAANPQSAQEAKSQLAVLAAKYPDDPRPEETLGFIAMRAGLQKDAVQHFARAVETHSQNPDVLFRLAHLKLGAEGASEEVVDLLQRAVAADGNNYNALLELGSVAAKTGKYDLAVESLEKIAKIKPEHVYVVYYTLAYSLIEVHQGNRARQYAEQARRIAGSSQDREQVTGLMRYINQESPLEVATR